MLFLKLIVPVGIAVAPLRAVPSVELAVPRTRSNNG